MKNKKNEHIHEEAEKEEPSDALNADETAAEQGEDLPDANKAVRELEEKLKFCEDKYIRAHADFENIKKRYEKEKYQAIDYAHEQFARDLLPVIDALEIAYTSADETSDEVAKKIKDGIGLTLEQFKKVFEKHGIKESESSGKFDPNFHNAALQVEAEGKESGDIVQTFQKGYTIKGRVLRAAMVSIAR
ncbi:MAG: nucleotide exchange factor GrpE [Campylobacteraceae bacterium]|jgi:molecular chaperone GrpE|nr:nucleotide exchange factor GrpE [Campylobacteraceae bacterium]